MSRNEELALKNKKECLVFDIETSSFYPDGTPVNIKTQFNDYVAHAVVKWVGAYSYKYEKYYLLNAITQKEIIKKLFSRHKTFVGFNNIQFDMPIMKNNDLCYKYLRELDMQVILGNNIARGHKNRASYMRIDLKDVVINGKKYGPNSLMSMAYHFGLDTLKGDIDYKIFYKNEWSEEETKEIKKYLYQDVKVTKELFDRTFDFWFMFSEFVTIDEVNKWKWLNTSIASMTYCSDCKVLGVEPTFGDRGEDEEMGGRAIKPAREETYGAYYEDEASKYPHTFAEFNLFSEIDVSNKNPEAVQKAIDQGLLFHGNEKFKVRGYYDIRKQGVLEKDIIEKLKKRFAIKKILKDFKKTNNRFLESVPEILKDVIPTNELTSDVIKKLQGLEYALKLLLNANYGLSRSSVFPQVHSNNCGFDCCWIGQQIHEYVQDFFEERGFRVIGGFTDSWFIDYKEGVSSDEVTRLANECLDELKQYMPFPADTHVIAFETFIDYILYHYDDKKKEYKKNNYAYISEGKVKIVGFPIMKNNATQLSMTIFNKYLAQKGIKQNRLKFPQKEIDGYVRQELQNDITLTAVRVKVNEASSYKVEGQLQRQVSIAYFNGGSGTIELIKNKKIGRVGKGDKYCSLEEATTQGLCFEDLVLDKVYNELDPFIIKAKAVTLEDF